MRQVVWENSLPSRKFYLNDVQLRLCIPNNKAIYTINNLTNEASVGFASWIDEWVDQSSLVIDVGANFGIVSIYAALKKQCKVVAFEPHFGTYYCFYRNIISNRLQHCIYPFQLALSTSSGFTNKFDISDATAGRALNSLMPNPDSYVNADLKRLQREKLGLSNEDEDVRAKAQMFQCSQFTSLDTFMMMFKEPTLNSSVKHLKVDIDGLDLLVLAGAVNTLNDVKTIYIEYLPESIGLSSMIPEFCKQYGFSVVDKDDENLILHKS